MHRVALFFVSLLGLAVAAGVAQQRQRPGEGRTPEWPAPSIIEYKPDSRLVVDQHPVPKAKFPVIDVHSHQFRLDAAMLDELVASMDRLNLQLLVNLSGGSGDELRQKLETIRTSKHADRMRLFANVSFENVGPGFGDKAARQLEADIKAGALGLKIYKNLGLSTRRADGTRLKLDDPELDPIWAACARLNVPVLIHTGDPAPFFDPIDYKNERWLELALFSNRRFQDPKFPRFDELMGERDRLFLKHSKTRFIAAHMGWHANDLGRLSKMLDRMPNVYVETGAILYDLGRQPRAARAFFEKYQDRVMFGKDSYQHDEFPYYWRTFETADDYFDYYRDYHAFWKLYGLALPDPILRKLYHQNALKVVPGLPAKAFTD